MKKYTITAKDLMEIHSFAVKECIDLPTDSEFNRDSHKLMAYSWTSAVIMFLNSKGLTEIKLGVDKALEDVR